MAFEMNQLQGFMRLGPQVYPARANAAMVIERGPHGQRIAADPVAVRLASKKRGSGFRFWTEELNVPADEAWNPPQAVVGLLGMGAGGPGAKPLGCSSGAPPPPDFGPRPPSGRSGAGALYQAIVDSARAACRGRASAARRILDAAWEQWSPSLDTSEEIHLRKQFRKAHSYISELEGESARLLAETRAREKDRSQSLAVSPEDRVAAREEVRCSKLGKGSYAAFRLTGTCPDVAIPDTKKIVTMALLAGAALIGVYGFASGFGRGVAGR